MYDYGDLLFGKNISLLSSFILLARILLISCSLFFQGANEFAIKKLVSILTLRPDSRDGAPIYYVASFCLLPISSYISANL